MNFTFENWHLWQGQKGLLLSDEYKKSLRGFDTVDQVINYLFVNGHRTAARALHAYVQAKHEG